MNLPRLVSALCTTSDKPAYGAHGLALLKEMRTWGVVRQGGVPGRRIIGTAEGGCVENRLYVNEGAEVRVV
jgi:hypothetical protein